MIETCIKEVYPETTNMTPLELRFNQKPTNIWMQYIDFDRQMHETPYYETKLQLAKQEMREKGRKRATKTDLNHKIQQVNVGNWVLVEARVDQHNQNRLTSKFLSVYEGPYLINRQISISTFKLWDVFKNKDRGMCNINSMKKYNWEKKN